jgi:hypothetical protein
MTSELTRLGTKRSSTTAEVEKRPYEDLQPAVVQSCCLDKPEQVRLLDRT